MGYRLSQLRMLRSLLRERWKTLIPAAIAADCKDIALPALNGRAEAESSAAK